MSAYDVEEIAEKMGRAFSGDSGLGGTVKIDFGDAGCIFVDGVSKPNAVVVADMPADCTIRIDLDHFLQMVAGQLDPAMAYMQGKLKVEGDMALAVRLGPALRDARQAREGS